MCLEKDGEVLFFHTFESPVFFQLNFFPEFATILISYQTARMSLD